MTDLPTERSFPTTWEEMLEFNADAIDDLIEQLKTPDRVLPFVGAGLGFVYGLKGWTQYLHHHAKDRGISAPINEMLQKNEYEAAAMHLKVVMGDLEFQRAIRIEYGEKRLKQFEPKGASWFLHRLTQGPILTTNYDRVIEKTFEYLGLTYDVAVGAQVTATQDAIAKKKRIVLKLHGDAEEETNRILSGDDYDRHYGTGSDKGFDPEKELPKALSRLMSNSPLLFLGCSLGEDRTLKVLHAISQSIPGLQHFAVLEAPADENAFQLARQRLSNHRIVPIWYGPGQHHLLAELLEYLCQDLPDPAQKNQPQDTRLHQEGNLHLQTNEPFFGRTKELQDLHDWLDSKTSVGNVYSAYNVKGAPGIGKSRLCHRFLEEYLAANPSQKVHYIELTGAQNASAFLAKLMEGLHLPEEPINAVIRALQSSAKTAVTVPIRVVVDLVDQVGGIVYLDNLEDALNDSQTEKLLSPFAHMRHTRLLCSSRKTLPTDIAHNLPLDRLDDKAAEELFLAHWKRSGAKEIVLDDVGKAFIHKDLDNHALSIKLVAAQGQAFASQIPALIQEWKNAALALAHSGAFDPDKQHSLEVSLNLSFEALRSLPQNPLPFWALVAMFPEGMSQNAQARLFDPGWRVPTPPTILIQYSILERDEERRLRMLAPVREYILAQLRASAGELDWIATLKWVAEEFWVPITQEQTPNDHLERDQPISQLNLLSNEFKGFAFFVEEATRSGEDWTIIFSKLLEGYNFVFELHAIDSFLTLECLQKNFEQYGCLLPQAVSLCQLGNVTAVLGELNLAEKYYIEALTIGVRLNDRNLFAKCCMDLGELYDLQGETDKAKSAHNDAFKLFEDENNLEGMLQVDINLVKIDYRLGHYEDAKKRISEIILISERNGLIRHLMGAYSISSDIEKALMNWEKAKQQLNLAHSIASQEDIGSANRKLGLADLEYIQLDFGKARILGEESLDLSKRLGYKLGEANATKLLACIDIQNGDIDSGFDKLNAALDIYSGLYDNAGLANTLAIIAVCLNSRGNIDDRDQATEDAYRFANITNSPLVLDFVRWITQPWSKPS